MVNGASGDGKSSLIYAGGIPYALAGFFKAKYNNWIVADFKPERSPLKNLTASICRQLKIEDAVKTEKELGYGFSALCDLYKASSFYIDETQPEWLNAEAANDGEEEMDLIHLAKVGGISAKMLKVEDRNAFLQWFENLPAYKKKLLETPSLSNVLNAHANELLFQENNATLTLSEIENSRNVKIIKRLFQSLTSYDKGRIVRRRASVDEVMELVNDPALSLNEFNAMLLKFGIEGNSFIKPYLSESSEILNKDVILDITHESLIRNWKLVEQWVLEEEENVQTCLEIEKPLQIWKKNISTRSSFVFWTWKFSKIQKYVLSSGLYNLYNNWHRKFPVYLPWLKRISQNYSQNDIDDFNHFLKQSKQVDIWSKIQPFLFAGIILYFVFKINQNKLREADAAIKNEKIQKELVVKAEENASLALLAKHEAESAKQESDSLKNIAIHNELRTKKELEYLIENASPIVMPGKMNLMYVGVENPFDFAVSGFNAKDIEPIIEVFPETARNKKCQLKKLSNGSYTLKIPAGINGVKINALAKIGNERKMLKGNAPYFRVKLLPDPIAVINGFNNRTNFKASELKNFKQITGTLLNFDFDVQIKILSFSVAADVGGEFIAASTTGSYFSDEMIKIFFRGDAFIALARVPRVRLNMNRSLNY
jgi:hypothetical protein